MYITAVWYNWCKGSWQSTAWIVGYEQVINIDKYKHYNGTNSRPNLSKNAEQKQIATTFFFLPAKNGSNGDFNIG